MFFRKRRQRPEPEDDPYPTPQWLKWVLIGFILFSVVHYHVGGKGDQPNPLKQAIDKASQDLRPSNFVNFTEYKEIVFPSYRSKLRIKDLALGKGLPALCGQEATISYVSWLGKENKLGEATQENPLRFVIGEGTAMPVFEQGIIGMQPGGTRSLLTPMRLSYGIERFKNPKHDIAPTANVIFNVTLHTLKPALPDPDASPYRIAVTRSGAGQKFVCGSKVKIHATFWNIQGEKLYTTYGEGKSPLLFTLGSAQVFTGLEQGVVGMKIGENRTIVVPPAFQKPLRDNKQVIDFSFPKNETILVDVELIQ